MAFLRMLVSWGKPADLVRDRLSNTLYFNVSGGVGQDPDYQQLADDLRTIYASKNMCNGCKIEVRVYDMADAKPRPEKAYATVTNTGTMYDVPHQIAVALSYYADRNLPRQRGRIFTGPWSLGGSLVPSGTQNEVLQLGKDLANLGGVNVDWSLYSPTTAAGGGDGHTRISNIWVDNSWDVIRSRKIAASGRVTFEIDG